MRPTSAVILVGGSTPSRIRSQFGMPVCLLPLPFAQSILTAWFELLSEIDSVTDITVVTGRPDDLDCIKKTARDFGASMRCELRVTTDRKEHRGTAGTVRDVIRDLDITNDVLVVEGTTIPPSDSTNLMNDYLLGDGIMGILVTDPNSEPAGLVLLRNEIFDLVPEVGFFDLKEQLLPRVVEDGGSIRISRIKENVRRITRSEEYNGHIARMARTTRMDSDGPWIHETAEVDPSAIISPSVIVGRGARIGAGAVVIESVILEGAEVRSESLVARSTIKANTQVSTGSRIVESMEMDDDVRRNPMHNRPGASSSVTPPRYTGLRR